MATLFIVRGLKVIGTFTAATARRTAAFASPSAGEFADIPLAAPATCALTSARAAVTS